MLNCLQVDTIIMSSKQHRNTLVNSNFTWFSRNFNLYNCINQFIFNVNCRGAGKFFDRRDKIQNKEPFLFDIKGCSQSSGPYQPKTKGEEGNIIFPKFFRRLPESWVCSVSEIPS